MKGSIIMLFHVLAIQFRIQFYFYCVIFYWPKNIDVLHTRFTVISVGEH
jgi:hypothetical protein